MPLPTSVHFAKPTEDPQAPLNRQAICLTGSTSLSSKTAFPIVVQKMMMMQPVQDTTSLQF
jgi:hypothetical protein